MSARTIHVRTGHPRVLVRPDQLPLLRQRAKTTHAEQMQSLLVSAELGPQAGSGKDYSEDIWRLAFLHLLTGELSHAQTAIKGLEELLKLPVSGEYFTGARRLKALAVSYDWMHAALGDELRLRVGRAALAYCQALYDSGEIEPGCYLLGHAINQMPFVLMAGIAIGDEIDGATHFIQDTLDRVDKQLPGYRHFLSHDCFQQSYSYTSTYAGEFPYLFQAMEAGLGIDMFQANPWLANVAKWWTYALRDDDTFLRFGDYFCAIPVFTNPQYFRPLAAIASRYKDGLAQWWVDRFKLTNAEPDQFLFEDREAADAKGPDAFQCTRLFDPMGIVIARGDFKHGTVASFKCTPLYLHNHGHRDANSFTIYHKGDQAIDSGAYDAYETPHWYNYYIRTIAHNSMVVHDSKEEFDSRGKIYANDGGQRFINKPHFQPSTFEDIESEAFRDGRIVSYLDGDGWSYVCGDASNCYSKQKLTKFLRHATFILDWPRPTCVSMLVLDEIELVQPGLEPRFLLHTAEEPHIDGQRVFSSHGGGRLTTTVLWPASPTIEKIGGPGREFEVERKNFPLNRQLPGPHVPGAWRTEISGGTGLSRRFLTLLVPADVDMEPEPAAVVDRIKDEWIVRQGDLSIALTHGADRPALPGKRSIAIQLAR